MECGCEEKKGAEEGQYSGLGNRATVGPSTETGDEGKDGIWGWLSQQMFIKHLLCTRPCSRSYTDIGGQEGPKSLPSGMENK